MSANLPHEAQIVKSWLENHDLKPDVRLLTASTATAADAAAALGCGLGQIAKSLVFYDVVTKGPVLIIASGNNRVDKTKVGEYLHAKIKTAAPDYVLEKTGFAVGGVPPVGHKAPLRTMIDRDLMHYDVIYAAAGHPHTLFGVSPQTLIKLTSAEIIPIC